MRGTGTFVELVNEWSKNGVDPRDFAKPSGVISSQGSEVSDTAPPQPGWDYHTWHGRRDWPKVVFSSDDAYWVASGRTEGGQTLGPPMPIVHDEPIGFSEADIPGRRSNNPEVARIVGATCGTFCDGGTFHSDYGIHSVGWSPEVDSLARTFFRALAGAAG